MQNCFTGKEAEQQFNILIIDIWSPGFNPGAKGEIKGLNPMDGMTGFIIGATLTSACAVAVAKTLYEQVFCKFGLPRMLVVNAGSPQWIHAGESRFPLKCQHLLL